MQPLYFLFDSSRFSAQVCLHLYAPFWTVATVRMGGGGGRGRGGGRGDGDGDDDGHTVVMASVCPSVSKPPFPIGKAISFSVCANVYLYVWAWDTTKEPVQPDKKPSYHRHACTRIPWLQQGAIQCVAVRYSTTRRQPGVALEPTRLDSMAPDQ